MNRSCGGHIAQTPPWPISTLVRRCRFVGENFARAKAAVAPTVFEDDEAVAEAQIEFQGALGVGVVFRDPQPAAGIPGHGDGILHVGFAGEERGFETGRELERRDGLGGGHGRAREVLGRAGVGGGGKLGAGHGNERGESGDGEGGEESEGEAHGGGRGQEESEGTGKGAGRETANLR
jgi:hypothetical protein